MANLAQLSTGIDSERGRASIAAMLEASPFLAFIDQQSGFEEKGTAFLYQLVLGAATLQRRAAGGEYTPEDRTPPSNLAGSLAMAGFSIDVDRSHRADEARGLLNVDNWINTELYKSVRKFAKSLETDCFLGSGSGSPRQMSGLKTIMDGTTDVAGFTGNKMTLNAADYLTGDSFDLSSASNYDAFIEAFELWISLLDNPSGVVCNRQAAARLTTIARVKHILGEQRDAFGNRQNTIAGIPIIRVLDTSILNTEPDDAGTPVNETTSLYLMQPGEGLISLATNSGLQFDDLGTLEGKESERVKGEVRIDTLIQDENVVRRVRNIKL